MVYGTPGDAAHYCGASSAAAARVVFAHDVLVFGVAFTASSVGLFCLWSLNHDGYLNDLFRLPRDIPNVDIHSSDEWVIHT